MQFDSLGRIPALDVHRRGRMARATRGDIPGLWDPRRVNQAWPEPVDNALIAYVPGLGTAGPGLGASGPNDPFGMKAACLSDCASPGVPDNERAECRNRCQRAAQQLCAEAGVDCSPKTLALPSWWKFVSTAGAIQGAYHGYKRNNSAGWAFGWFILGGLFPFFTIPLSFAQGFPSYKK